MADEDKSETGVSTTVVDPHPTLGPGPMPIGFDSSRKRTAMAKWLQFPVFYAEELALWQENPEVKGVSLHEFLYANREHYIGKSADELTDREILRGLNISGIHHGYTCFDSVLMDAVIEEWDVTSVYDPCAGWGERMLCCASHGIPYHGVDVNGALEWGYSAMVKEFGLVGCDFVNDDSSVSFPSGTYDAVITCPPYGPKEWYSDFGAENMDHDGFLRWWRHECDGAYDLGVRLLCFQINTAWRDPMLAIATGAGFSLVDELGYIAAKSSHFTRKKGGVNLKTAAETMLVMEAVR